MDENFEWHLEAAMRSRPVVEQATGVLSAHRRMSPTAAYDLLMKAAQRHDTDAVVLADALVSVVAGATDRVDERLRRVIATEWPALMPATGLDD